MWSKDTNPDKEGAQKRPQSCFRRLLKILYWILASFMIVMVLARFATLLNTPQRYFGSPEFPTQCSSKSSRDGCTRMMLHREDECVRVKDLAQMNIRFANPNGIYALLDSCTPDSAKKAAYQAIRDDGTTDGTTHLLYQSTIFGFIDDMFIIIDQH